MSKKPHDDRCSKPARKVAAQLWRIMRNNQRLFSHPKAKPLPQKQWDTVAWNAAWMAAEVVDGRI